MIAAMLARIRTLLGEQGLAPRERALVAAFAAILSVYGALSASDWAERAESRAIEAADGRRSAVAEASRLNDSFLSGMTMRQTERLRGWSYADATIAIARLKAQTALEDTARLAGVENARINGDPESGDEGRIRLFNATIEGAFRWDTFVALLTALGADPHSIEVTSIRVEGGQARPVFRMGVRVPVSVVDRRAPDEVRG